VLPHEAHRRGQAASSGKRAPQNEQWLFLFIISGSLLVPGSPRVVPRRYAPCEGARPDLYRSERMAVQFRTSGCLYSIIVSIVLTVLLNLAIHSCSGGGPRW
jgi:hypothetical protein